MGKLRLHGAILAVILAASMARASLGGINDGGACRVRDASGRQTLKDFVNFEPDYVDRSSPGVPIADENDKTLRNIHITELNGKFGSINIQETAAFENALRIVHAWKPYYPTISSYVIQALKTIHIYATDYYLHYPATGCTQPGDQPILIYSTFLMGPTLSIPMWNQLSFQAQTGALIKEAFRFLAMQDKGSVTNSPTVGPAFENKLSDWVGALVLLRPGSSLVIDRMIEPKTAFALDSELASEIVKIHRECLRLVPMARRLSLARPNCEQSGLNAVDYGHAVIHSAEIIEGVIVDRNLNGYTALDQVSSDLLDAEESLETLEVWGILGGPSLVGAVHSLNRVTEWMRAARPGSSPDMLRMPMQFDDLRGYLQRGWLGRTFGNNAPAFQEALRLVHQEINGDLKTGQLSQ